MTGWKRGMFFHHWSHFLYANFWSLNPKAWPIFVPDPTNMVQPYPWSLKKLLIPIPSSMIPGSRAVISDPTLLIPDPTPSIPDPTYLVTTLWWLSLSFLSLLFLLKNTNALNRWMSYIFAHNWGCLQRDDEIFTVVPRRWIQWVNIAVESRYNAW